MLRSLLQKAIRTVLALAVVLSTTAGQAYDTPGGRRFVLAWDLDEFLIYQENSATREPGAKYVTITYPTRQGDSTITETYRVADGAEEFLTSILTMRIPGMAEIVPGFVSAGERARNEALLKELHLLGALEGKTWWEVARFVRGNQDMHSYPKRVKSALPGGGNDKKKHLSDLGFEILGSDLDLSDVTLMDDHTKYTVPGQERNLLLVDDYKMNVVTGPVEDALLGISRSNIRATRDAVRGYIMSRNKLAFARALYERLIRQAIDERRPLADIQLEAQWEPEGANYVYRRAIREDMDLYREGVRIFKAINPEYHFTSLVSLEDRQRYEDVLRLIRESGITENYCGKMFHRTAVIP